MAKKMTTKALVIGAILTALVFVLQLVSMNLRFSAFSITLTLIPIVIGTAIVGKGMGAWLGFVFGVAVLATGDAAAFLAVNPLGTVATVLVKGILAGFVTGLVYEWLIKKAKGKIFVSTLISAIVCPVVNTGVFLIGCRLFFMSAITEWAMSLGFGDNVGEYMIVGLVGINFLIEFGINLVLSPVIVRVLKNIKE